MTPKTAKIKKILKVRKYDGQHGTTYYFTLEMDNGDKGEIGKKNETALNVGDSLTYETTEKNGYVHFKEFREQNGSGPRRFAPAPSASPAVVALTVAQAITAANIAVSGKPLEMNDALAKRMTDFAGHIETWLKARQG